MPDRFGKLLQTAAQHSILVTKIWESQSTATSLAYGNFHRLVNYYQLLMNIINPRQIRHFFVSLTKGNLLREKSFTLDNTIGIARSNEITSRQLESMKSNTNDSPKEEGI